MYFYASTIINKRLGNGVITILSSDHYIAENEVFKQVINNDIYKDRILQNKEWQERYSLEKFEKSYIDLII